MIWLVSALIIAVGGTFCWAIYKVQCGHSRFDAVTQTELDEAHAMAMIQDYWRDRGEIIRPVITRHCAALDEHEDVS